MANKLTFKQKFQQKVLGYITKEEMDVYIGEIVYLNKLSLQSPIHAESLDRAVDRWIDIFCSHKYTDQDYHYFKAEMLSGLMKISV